MNRWLHNFRWKWPLLLLLWGGNPAVDVSAEPGTARNEFPTVTNIFQLGELVQNTSCTNAAIAIQAVVCNLNRVQHTLILQDSSGAQLLDLESLPEDLEPGQTVILESGKCKVFRRRTGLAVRQGALVDNDGEHKLTERAATTRLDKGIYPIRVDWFNKAGASALMVEISGPGIGRQRVPDDLLFYYPPESTNAAPTEMPGLHYAVYQGNWLQLPDFNLWPEIQKGIVLNFNLGRWTKTQNIGMVFSGNLRVPATGNYTFYLSSDDGSCLYLGNLTPPIKIIGAGKVPETKKLYLGQIWRDRRLCQWAQTEGFIRFVTRHAGRLEMDLLSPSNNRLQLEVLDDAGLPPEYLLNAKVRVAGMAQSAFSAGAQKINGLMTALDVRDIQIIDLPSQTWNTHPILSLKKIVTDAADYEGKIVHAMGRLEANGGDLFLESAGYTGRVKIARTGESAALAGQDVEAIGQFRQLKNGPSLENACLRAQPAIEDQPELPRLTTAEEVLRLKPDEVAKGYPVRLRGVVTCIWPDDYRNLVLQDSTRGIFVKTSSRVDFAGAQPGEFWEASGVTGPGYFSPIIVAQRFKFLGEGRFPEPVHPSWDQLSNGSLDNQYVEIEGIITRIERRSVSLLTHWGRVNITLVDQKPAALKAYENKLVRIRGCFLAEWDAQTHQVKVGQIQLGNITINADETLPADPFATPIKALAELMQFDAQASAFHSVHVVGQVISRRDDEFFMMGGTSGLRFVASHADGVKIGDRVEVVGYPELNGPSPVLRDAVVRKLGEAPLPAPSLLGRDDLVKPGLDATLVRIDAVLVGWRKDRGGLVLELQAGLRPFQANYRGDPEKLPSLRIGSRLQLVGVYSSLGTRRGVESGPDSFELLLDAPGAIKILAQPSWWTLRRLFIALGLVLVVLMAVTFWLFQLRRQVEAQTKIIRKNIQHAATLEERSRIARELHDTLEQALAGISFQLGALAGALRGVPQEVLQILDLARLMVRHGQEEARRSVRNLRMFALERNNLSTALTQIAAETFRGGPVKTEVTVTGTPVPLPVELENHLLRFGQEALTNGLKHARAKNINIDLVFEKKFAQLKITDDGCGFDIAGRLPTETGHFGLLGMRERADKMGGTMQIISRPGAGTTISIQVPLPAVAPAV